MHAPMKSFLPRFLFVAEGGDAADRGEPATANPYPDGTLQFGYWHEGWAACQGTCAADGASSRHLPQGTRADSPAAASSSQA